MPAKSPRKTPSKRQYKVTPLSERLVNAPWDFLLYLNEWFQLCEWDEALERTSNPLGIALNVIYLIVKGYSGDAFTDDEFIEYSALKSKTASISLDGESTWFTTLARVCEFAILIISLLNTIHLFSRTKTITLFLHPTEPNEDRPYDNSWNLALKSRNARLVPVDVAATDPTLIESDSEDDEAVNYTYTPTPLKKRSGGSVLGTPIKTLRETMVSWSPWSAGKGKPARKAKKAAGPTATKVEMHWVLSVWDPKKWSLNLFCWLSPPGIFTLYAMNHNNWSYLLPTAFLTHAMVHGLIFIFLQKLIDQDILNGQLQKEYNKFVYSLPPFRQTKTVGVQTR